MFLAAGGFDVAGAGWVGFDRQMRFKTTVIFSRAMTDEFIKEIPAAKYAVNADGRIEIPLNISGLTTDPALTLDYAVMAARVQDNLLKDAGDKLGDKFKDLFGGKKD